MSTLYRVYAVSQYYYKLFFLVFFAPLPLQLPLFVYLVYITLASAALGWPSWTHMALLFFIIAIWLVFFNIIAAM
tara:strand:- start:424 stop:648 length:225 start_codon:yes stop_codon:yes gene_type:complete